MFCLARLFYWLLILPIVLFYHGRFLQCLMYRLAIFISDLCVVFFLLHFLESCCRAAAQLQCIQCMDTMETIGNENTSSKRSFWYERAHTHRAFESVLTWLGVYFVKCTWLNLFRLIGNHFSTCSRHTSALFPAHSVSLISSLILGCLWISSSIKYSRL